MEKRLTQAMENLLLKKQQQLDLQANQLRHPKEIIQRQQDQLVTLEKRLTLGWQHQQKQSQQRVEQLEHRLKQASPDKLQQQSQQDLSALEQRLYKSVQNQLAKQNQTLAQLSHRLETVSPLATLSRGYAIVEDDQGNIIRHHQQVEEGDTVTARLAEGQLICQVQHKTT
jgi:exodeoxyribonuclease VII large subunit